VALDVAARRLNLPAIEASLQRVQRAFSRINARLRSPRDPMGTDVVRNMVAGYALVDDLVAAGIDVFAMGNLKHLLELNTVVLCGNDPARRQEYARHRATTEQRFYEEREGGVRDLVEWLERHDRLAVWKRAAGAYVRVLSRPQLFVEGNHRTGTLVMSYLLVREGEPPFVLAPENAAAYFDPSTAIRTIHKQGLAMLLRSPGLRRRVVRVLVAHADRRFLLDR
jgi:hypothetical protein